MFRILFDGAKVACLHETECQVDIKLTSIFSFDGANLPCLFETYWQVVNKLSSHFSFWRCKGRHFHRLESSTVYKVKKLFLSEGGHLPRFCLLRYDFRCKGRMFGSPEFYTMYILCTFFFLSVILSCHIPVFRCKGSPTFPLRFATY